MVNILLDTCVISELRKPNGNLMVRDTIASIHTDHLFMSVITIGEITKGIVLLQDEDRKKQLADWLDVIEQGYASRILPIDHAIARIWGEMTALARNAGKTLSVSDGLIAATAYHHGMHLMTRNISDFLCTGILLINPWEGSTVC